MVHLNLIHYNGEMTTAYLYAPLLTTLFLSFWAIYFFISYAHNKFSGSSTKLQLELIPRQRSPD